MAVESFAEDAVDHDPAPGQGPGRKGFSDFLTSLATAFPDAHIESEQVVADEDHVAVAYTLTGTHEGDFNGVSPTGNKIEVRASDRTPAAIGELGRAPKDLDAILLTHGHPDHVGAAEALRQQTGSTVLARSLAVERVRGRAPGSSPFRVVPSLATQL